jgi:hypothetical protein
MPQMYYSNPVAYGRRFVMFDNALADALQSFNAMNVNMGIGVVRTGDEVADISPMKMEIPDVHSSPLNAHHTAHSYVPGLGYQDMGEQQHSTFNNGTMFGAGYGDTLVIPQTHLQPFVMQAMVTMSKEYEQQQQFQVHQHHIAQQQLQHNSMYQMQPVVTSNTSPAQLFHPLYSLQRGGAVVPASASASSFDYANGRTAHVKHEADGPHDSEEYGSLFYPGGRMKYAVVRGISAGGCATRPPKSAAAGNLIYMPVELDIVNAGLDECCYPQWSADEKSDHRRIIRIERQQCGPKVIATFLIVGSANEHPTSVEAPRDTDVVEVSCLECGVRFLEDEGSPETEDSPSAGGHVAVDAYGYNNSYYPVRHNSTDASQAVHYNYYITSVEVVEIVELLIGMQLKDSAERRKERGRVRSNLVPFWSKRPILSRMSENSGLSDFRAELAKRIMAYDIRKPRGFDKEVRILRWDKLVPALKRALQSYYTEIPQQDAHFFLIEP